MTLYTGVRLNNSTEILVDIEGLAAPPQLGCGWRHPDPEHHRAATLLSKALYVGRGMIHKVIALSKDKVENQRSYLAL